MARTWPTVLELQTMLYGAGVISELPPTGRQDASILDYQGALDAAKDDFEKDTTIKPFLADGSEAQKQYIQFTGSPGGGTVKLSYNGTANTGTIAYNATAAAVQAQLETITALTGKVTVTGDAGGPYTVVLDASLYPYYWLVLNTNSLTGGTSPSLTVDEPPEYEDGPRHNVLRFRDYWFSIRSLSTGRVAGQGGAAQTLHTNYELQYKQGSKAIEAVNFGGWYGTGANATEVIGRRGYTDDLPANVKIAVMAKAALHPMIMPALGNIAGKGAARWKEGDVEEQYGTAGIYSGFGASMQSLYDETVCEYRRMRGAGSS